MKRLLLVLALVACKQPSESRKDFERERAAARVKAAAPPPAPAKPPHNPKLPQGMCEVTLCNKLERLSLSPLAHISDAIGETCFTAVLPEALAKDGNEVGSESRWWQGRGFNPTKKSVTRVDDVRSCNSAP